MYRRCKDSLQHAIHVGSLGNRQCSLTLIFLFKFSTTSAKTLRSRQITDPVLARLRGLALQQLGKVLEGANVRKKKTKESVVAMVEYYY